MQFLADENSKEKFRCHGYSKLVTMFVVALSLAGHFVPCNLPGVYMQPCPTQAARQRSAKSRRQPAACTAVPRLRRLQVAPAATRLIYYARLIEVR